MGVNKVTVHLVGAGGGGASPMWSGLHGGGGGGGGYSKISFAVTPFTSYQYKVGCGGDGYTSKASDGGNTEFNGSVAYGGVGADGLKNGLGGVGNYANGSTGNFSTGGACGASVIANCSGGDYPTNIGAGGNGSAYDSSPGRKGGAGYLLIQW